MSTIPKNTKRARNLLLNARNIRCYSLSNNFAGNPLADNPTVWGEAKPGEHYRPMIQVTQAEFLRRELVRSHGAKLTETGNGHYTIHIHSNLWFDFEA